MANGTTLLHHTSTDKCKRTEKLFLSQFFGGGPLPWIVLWSLCGAVGPAARADIEASGPTSGRGAVAAVSLAKTLINQHDALFALSLVYKEVQTSRSGPPERVYLRRFVAASRPGLFIRDNGHGHDRQPWTDDPFRKTLLVTPTESTLLENLNRLVVDFEYERSGAAPSPIQDELIFEVLCWWPFTEWPPPERRGYPFAMSTLLKDGAYQLLPRTESVQSRPCYILEIKKGDYTVRIWIDCERPKCVLRKEIYNPKTRSVASRYEMMDYKDAGDGIWLPGRFRNTQFDSNAHTPQLRARVVIDATFLISDVRINHHVSPETFRLDLLPGTVRKVVSTDMERYEPVRDGQIEYFMSILDWSRSVTGNQAGRNPRLWGRPHLILFAIGVVGAAVAFVLARRPLARRRLPHGTSPLGEGLPDTSASGRGASFLDDQGGSLEGDPTR